MELILAAGPLRYLGGSIETFALPYGAFIVIAWVLFYIYRRPHDVPRLKYLRPAHQVSLGTREPGTEGIVYIASAHAASPTAAPEAEATTQAEAPAETEAAETEAAGTVADAGAAGTVADAGAAGTMADAGAAEPEETADAGHDSTTAEGETF
jgi:hypothetical protein